MKNLTLLLNLTLFNFAFGQIYSVTLEQNNASIILSNGGTLFQDLSNVTSGYEIPKGSGLNTIFSTQFWFAGKKNDGSILTSTGGHPSLGRDIFPGPYSDSLFYNDPSYIDKWGISMWNICQSEIEVFKKWWDCSNGLDTVGCETMQVPTSESLDRIYSWPAHGDISHGLSYYMAPFWDNNSDGVYNPNDGDYPLIKGCCAVYMIQNDHAGIHTNSGTQAIEIEIQTMFYQYSTFDFLNDVTFIDVLTINKGTNNYLEFNSGLFMDANIGSYSDDFFGSDSTNNLMYFYNADNYDENFYLANPPAIGVVSLENEMSTCTPYDAPSNETEIWNLMSGKKIDGQNWLHPDGYSTNYIYSGNPTIISEWNESSTGNPSGDRRAIMTHNNGVFNTSDSIFQSYAIVYARSGDNLQNVQTIIDLASEVKTFYINDLEIVCDNGTSGIEEELENDFILYPNPSSGQFQIVSSHNLNIKIQLFDVKGNQIQTEIKQNSNGAHIDLSKNARGIYILKISNELGSSFERIVLE